MDKESILKNLRVSKNLTQAELANIIDINRVQYNQYENDYNTTPIRHLNSLANYFNVSIDYILGLSQTCNYNNARNQIDKELSGMRLKELRKKYKLTQDKFSKILNVSRTTITEYERGTNIIATPFLYTICNKYKVSADYILGKIDEEITLK